MIYYKMFDYEYVKNHCRLIAAHLSRQKELNDNPKAIQKIEFDGKFLKKICE